MGVKGDPKRVSVVIAKEPFMGLVPESTTSWAEKEYSSCFVNSCWELYGVVDEKHFPRTGSTTTMRIETDRPNSIVWDTDWNATLEDGGCSKSTISEKHNATVQEVKWVVDDPPS